MVRAEAPGYNTPPEMIREFRFALNPEGASNFVYRTRDTAYVYRTGEPFFSNDPAADARFNQEFDRALPDSLGADRAAAASSAS